METEKKDWVPAVGDLVSFAYDKKIDHPMEVFQYRVGFTVMKVGKDIGDDRRMALGMSNEAQTAGMEIPLFYDKSGQWYALLPGEMIPVNWLWVRRADKLAWEMVSEGKGSKHPAVAEASKQEVRCMAKKIPAWFPKVGEEIGLVTQGEKKIKKYKVTELLTYKQGGFRARLHKGGALTCARCYETGVLVENFHSDWALADGDAGMTLSWRHIEQVLLYRPKVVFPRPKKRGKK